MFEKHIISKLILSFILPIIVIYSLYIQFNGEVSPGGGFQAGVIFASAIIGYDMISEKTMGHIFSINYLIILSCIGCLIYAVTGLISIYFDSNYLNYNILASTKQSGQHLGIFLIEVGVGITVASVMILIYFLLKDNNNHG